MSDRTGLGDLEVTLLQAVEDAGGTPTAAHLRTTLVLDQIARSHGLGLRHAYPLLVDLAVPWRRHLPLLDAQGNLGSQYGGSDTPADARYTEVRLSRVGALALAAERGEVGPLPLGIIEGTLWADGDVPPFAPRAVLEALITGSADAGPPVTPTGGTVQGALDPLLAGRPARIYLGCTVLDEGDHLVITEVPLGTAIDDVLGHIASRSREQVAPAREYADYVDRTRLPGELPPVVDLLDETSSRSGIRVVVRVRPGVDLETARRWLLSIWPVTVEVEWRLPAPMPTLLGSWDRGDGSGLTALTDLL